MKLKSWILAVTLAIATLARGATNDLTGLLQKGLFEEEANRDLNAAISEYQSLASAFDKDRQLAATAIFRLGECYRKLGKTNEAVAQYNRIINEFSDQQTLATLSRQNLAGLNATPKAPAANTDSSALLEAEANAATLQSQLDEIQKMPSRDQQRIFVQQNFPNPVLTTLIQELNLAEQSLTALKLDYTVDHPKYKNALEMVKGLNEKVDAQVSGAIQSLQGKLAETQIKLRLLRQRTGELAGTSTGGGGGFPNTQNPDTTDEEQTQIRNIQLMIQNSPDLINAPNTDGMTPLLLAAEKGQLVVAKYLLDHGADVNGLSRNHGNVPLTEAVGNGHKAMVELLLARGADVNGKGLNPLFEAVKRGYSAVAEVLLANKADANLRGAETSGNYPVHLATRDDKIELLQLLINHGADVNVADNDGRTPLELAASQNKTNAAKLLLDAKASVDAKDKTGNTPLHEAANWGYTGIISLLLSSGATVDATNNGDATPLLLAVFQNKTEATRMLLDHKADPNHAGKAGGSASASMPVYYAIFKDEVLKMLLDAGASPEGNMEWTSPLSYAIEQGKVDAVQLLLQHGANPNRANRDGICPLLQAIKNPKSKAAIPLLLDKGADPNARSADVAPPLFFTQDPEIGRWLVEHKADVNARLAAGQTPLINGAWSTNYVKFLLEAGAKPDFQDTNGNTALHNALYYSAAESVALLLAHKANPNIQNNQGYTPLDLAKVGMAGRKFGSMLVPGSEGQGPLSSETFRKISDLLIAAGGLANLPKRDRIEVRRASDSILTILKDAQNRNRYSLLEVIGNTYGVLSQWTTHSGQVASNPPWPNNEPKFPDFKNVIIYRRTGNSPKQTTTTVNVADILKSGDCSKDMWLEWGDIVEIPEADHPVDQHWYGMNEKDREGLTKCAARQITIIVKGETKTLNLLSEPTNAPVAVASSGTTSLPISGNIGFGKPVPGPTSFMLRPILNHSGLVRVSSDLSRVKVTRVDPITKQTVEWIVDCTSDEDPDLWLRDGDVIEVPEK